VLPRLPQGARTELGPDATPARLGLQYALVDESAGHSLAELRSYQDWYLKYSSQVGAGVRKWRRSRFRQAVPGQRRPNRLQPMGFDQQGRRGGARGQLRSSGRLIEFGGTEYNIRDAATSSPCRTRADRRGYERDGAPVRLMDIGEVVLGRTCAALADLDGEGDVVSGIVVIATGRTRWT